MTFFRRALGVLVAGSLVALPGAAPARTPRQDPERQVVVSKEAGLGRVEVHGKIGAVLQRDEGTVALLDLSGPIPKVVGRYDTAKDSLDGDLAFSADGNWLIYARQTKNFDEEGVHVLDVSDPSNPSLAYYLPAGGSYRVQYIKQGDAEWVVLLDAIDGMVVNRFIPETGALVPVHVDALPALKVGGPASAGFFYDAKDPQTGKPLLYVTTGRTGVQVFDFSEPAAPVELGSWSEIGLAEVEVVATKSSRTIYAASEYWFKKDLKPEVVVLDATKLDKIKKKGSFNVGVDPAEGFYVQGMDVLGERLLVAHSTLGLAVFDRASGRLIPSQQYRPQGKRHPNAGVTVGGSYAIDVEAVGRTVYVTDAALGTLSVLIR